jgi:hypothetical protein
MRICYCSLPSKGSNAAYHYHHSITLTQFSGFCHPAPVYVFLQAGIVVDELRGANPPKLAELVRNWITRPRTENTMPEMSPLSSSGNHRRGSMSLYAPGDEPEPDTDAQVLIKTRSQSETILSPAIVQ